MHSAFPTIFTPQGDGNLTVWRSSFNMVTLFFIPDNIYPARGRKLDLDMINPKILLVEFPTIFTPQGDGNNLAAIASVFQKLPYSRQYLPRKGTETLGAETTPFLLSLYSRQYLPRKGTETTQLGCEDGDSAINSRQYLPRKGTETSPTKIALIRDRFIPDNIYPARGRKHSFWCCLQDGSYQKFPTIFTPQGDGNVVISAYWVGLSFTNIPDNIYPARGRKRKCPDLASVNWIWYSRQYLPRKGTETGCWFVY